MWKINDYLSNGLDGFLDVSPGIGSLAKAKWLRRAWLLKGVVMPAIPILKNKKVSSEIIGEAIGKYMVSTIKSNLLRRPRFIVAKMHHRAHYIKRRTSKVNGIGGRTWINPLIDADINGRVIKKMVIIYHDAHKAQKHIDIHIGHLSFIMRVSGKPVENDIKFNSKGELTQSAKDALVQHVRNEIFNHSRVPQNLDHSILNAKCTWYAGDVGLYG